MLATLKLRVENINRSLATSLRRSVFIFIFTFAAMGLNPEGSTSAAIAFTSLLFQILIFLSAIQYAQHNQKFASSLHHLYIINALSQLLIARILLPYLLSWVLVLFSLTFSKLPKFLLKAAYFVVDKAFGITDVSERNAMRIFFAGVRSVQKNPDMLMSVVTGMIGLDIAHLRGTAPGALQLSSVHGFSSLLAEMLPKIPLFFIIPIEVIKYYVLRKGVKSYQHGNMAMSCQDILVMGVVVSLPIANIQVVSSAYWSRDMFDEGRGEVTGIVTRCIVIIAAYASSMISCGMLAVTIAENGVRDCKMWSARIHSGLLMLVVDVMTRLCTLPDILSTDTQAVVSSTMLVMTLGAGYFVWSKAKVAQMTADEVAHVDISH